MVQRLSGASSDDLLQRDWDKSQVLSFSKTGRYKLDLPGIKHPCADALQPRTPANVPMIENRHATANNNQLVVFQQPQSSLAARFGNAALDFFMPAAYAEELPPPEKGSVSSNVSELLQQNKRHNYYQIELPISDSIVNFHGSNNASSSSSSTIQGNKFFDELEANWFEKCLIGSGRSTVAFGQKIKMSGIWAGEQAGIIELGTTENYTKQINSEKELYDRTPVGQSILGKTAEIGTDLFFGYMTGKVGFNGLKNVSRAAYSMYKTRKTIGEAFSGGKYYGELRNLRSQSINKVRKSLYSHKKTIAEHKEYIKNPNIKYQNWDQMAKREQYGAIRKWQKDIKRAEIYEELAKRVLNEKIPSTDLHSKITTPIFNTVDECINSSFNEILNKPPTP